MKTQTYTKINTLYKRYRNLNKVELPNKSWKKFQNKIIAGNFSDPEVAYLKDCLWDCYSKIDGTNTKIIFWPSTGVCTYGGKTDNADLKQHDKIMPEIVERITPMLKEMFPPETARYAQVMNDKNQPQYFVCGTPLDEVQTAGKFEVELVEVPIYIYGELFGAGVQKGGHYSKGLRFTAFDICQQGWWLPMDMFTDICNKLGIATAPFLGQMTLLDAENMVATGFPTAVPDVEDPNYIEEGIVARPIAPVKDGRGKRIIVKIKYCDYKELKDAIDEVGFEEYEAFHEWYMQHQDEIENAE